MALLVLHCQSNVQTCDTVLLAHALADVQTAGLADVLFLANVPLPDNVYQKLHGQCTSIWFQHPLY